LSEARTIAVLGAHPEAWRPACYVPDYLYQQGYRLLPVNPRYAGQLLWGQTVRASLTELAEPVDIVDVFRRSEDLPGHEAELMAMAPRPRVVWLQSGIRHDALAARLQAAGMEVVQDRCTLAEHRARGLPPRR
jgi:predicted CoA-binding protein